LDTFKDRVQIQEEHKVVEQKSKEEDIEELDDDVSPRQCLFCSQKFEDDAEDWDNILEHMSNDHGLFIPDQAMLSDLECFMGYLTTVVRVWHECLFCGTTRSSTLAIQSHMRDSSHCMLNLEREPELLEFWDSKSDEEENALDDVARASTEPGKELQLLSGKVVGSRRALQRKTKVARAKEVHSMSAADLESPSLPGSSKDQNYRQIARSDEMGIQNISPQQRHALVLAEKRSQKDEAAANRARDWIRARKANAQKYDQSYGPLSWAKGGAHNLLPR
jgi:pre-60S factor REI1